jgi:hypothetical protein
MLSKDFARRFSDELPVLQKALVMGFFAAIIIRSALIRLRTISVEGKVGMPGVRRGRRVSRQRERTHFTWSRVLITPLHGIDITGLDFSKAKIDRRTRRILRKNGAKA